MQFEWYRTLLQDAAREEPSNARTIKYVEEKRQKAAAEKEASEREVLHIHDEVVATGSQPTMPATRSPEEQDAMTKLQELARLDQRAEQLRSAAIALRTSAARSGADDAAVRQRQQLAKHPPRPSRQYQRARLHLEDWCWGVSVSCFRLLHIPELGPERPRWSRGIAA